MSSVGEIEASTCGLLFTHDVVGRFVHDEPMQAAGAALLWAAWEQREMLLWR
jgi:hypothetical protein